MDNSVDVSRHRNSLTNRDNNVNNPKIFGNMELRKKSILIALCIGDDYITRQKQIKKGRTYQYNYLEISHGQHQKEYIEWKANLCHSITGKKCRVREKIYKEKKYKNYTIPSSTGYTFTCSAKYFKVLRKWLYPNNKKKLDVKYLKYLDAQGLAIWYMDNGSTYVSKTDKCFTAEISTHIPEDDADALIEMFSSKWGILFHKHKRAENQYNLRCYSSNALKFIKLIEPFVPDCMAYKLIVPTFYFHECTASHLNRIKGMKIYSELQ